MKLNTLLEDNTSVNSYSSINSEQDNLSISSGHGCRICTEPVENEMQFCKCSGYVAIIHKECLLKWLSMSNKTHCEICNHKFDLHISKQYVWINMILMSIFILVTIIAYLYTFLFTQNNDVSIYILSALTTVLLIVSAIRNNKKLFIKKIIDVEEYYEQTQIKENISSSNSSGNQRDLHLNFHRLINDNQNLSINNIESEVETTERDRLLE